MSPREVPQPSLDRLVPVPGHPLVVGVAPEQSPIVVRTALSLARAVGGSMLHLAFVDPTRMVLTELPDGSVTHAPASPDSEDGGWERRRDALHDHLRSLLDGEDVTWRFWYLAGRPDRALTHLARAVDASIIVVGARRPGRGAAWRELVEGSVATHLAHHQHRPVLTVPLEVVDWKELRGPWR